MRGGRAGDHGDEETQTKRRVIRRGTLTPYLFLLPGLALFAAFRLYPLLDGLRLSFTNARLGRAQYAFVGLANYQKLLDDTRFHVYFKCEQCRYLPHCGKAVSADVPPDRRDLSAVPGLSHPSKQALLDAGIRSVAQLVRVGSITTMPGAGWGLKSRGELLRHRAGRQPGRGDDLVQADAADTLGVEQCGCGVEDPLLGLAVIVNGGSLGGRRRQRGPIVSGGSYLFHLIKRLNALSARCRRDARAF